MRTRTYDMTAGNIAKHLLYFSFPLMAENLCQLFYNTADSIIVGRCIGEHALAAVGATTYITYLFASLFMGLSSGCTVVVAQHFGGRQREQLKQAICNMFSLTLLCAALLLVIGTVLVESLLELTNAPLDVKTEAALYLKICFLGIPAIAIFNVGSGILRAVGNSRHPLYILVFVSILNIALDLLFVVRLHWGIAGAAWATVAAEYAAAAAILWLFAHTGEVYRFALTELQFNRTTVGQLLSVSMPMALERSLTCFSNVIVQAYVNVFGTTCIAGYSIFTRIELFPFMLITSLSVASLTFAGQNVGAGHFERLKKGTRTAVLIATALTAVVCGLIVLLRRPIAALFVDDPETIEFAARIILWMLPFYLASCLYNPVASTLKGLSDVVPVSAFMLFSFVGVRQIYLYFGTRFVMNTPLFVMMSYPAGWCACLVMVMCYYASGLWKRHLPAHCTNN